MNYVYSPNRISISMTLGIVVKDHHRRRIQLKRVEETQTYGQILLNSPLNVSNRSSEIKFLSQSTLP